MQLCKSIGCNAPVDNNLDFCSNCVSEYTDAIQKDSHPATYSPRSYTIEKLEQDPNGMDQHAPGAKVDAGKVRMHLITGGMARALLEVAKVGTFGAAKYSDNGWVHVPDGFRRYEDAQQRHAAYRHMGEDHDPDSKLLHLSHEAWNALAKLDLYLREHPSP